MTNFMWLLLRKSGVIHLWHEARNECVSGPVVDIVGRTDLLNPPLGEETVRGWTKSFFGLGKVALEYAGIQQRAQAVARQQQSSAQKVAEYANIARDMLIQLEAEYDRILAEATWCDTTNKEEVRNLGCSIHNYLRVDVLRPTLKNVVAGIEQCVNNLSAESYGLLNWQESQRDVALAKWRKITSGLADTLSRLEQSIPGELEGRPVTGYGKEHLLKLEELLQKRAKTPLAAPAKIEGGVPASADPIRPD